MCKFYDNKLRWVYFTAVTTFVISTLLSYYLKRDTREEIFFNDLLYLEWYYNEYQSVILDKAHFYEKKKDYFQAAKIYIIIESSRTLALKAQKEPHGYYAKKALRLLGSSSCTSCQKLYKAYFQYLSVYDPDAIIDYIAKD